jgi:hypothetical protein
LELFEAGDAKGDDTQATKPALVRRGTLPAVSSMAISVSPTPTP